MKKIFDFIFETLKITFLAVAIVLPIRFFIFQPFIVSGGSMYPNFENSDYLIVDEISYKIKDPQRGEVIVFRAPNQPSSRYIKRIIGLPGEIVEVSKGTVVIFDQGGEKKTINETAYLPDLLMTPGQVKILLGEDEYFVLGDNRMLSSDSRSWGALPRKNIIGRALLRAWPVDELSIIRKPNYTFAF